MFIILITSIFVIVNGFLPVELSKVNSPLNPHQRNRVEKNMWILKYSFLKSNHKIRQINIGLPILPYG